MKPIHNTVKKKARKPIPQSVRFNVFRRDDFKCRYCGKSSPEVELHCDHAISVKDGGADTEDNLVTACINCNLGKSSASVKRRANPDEDYESSSRGLVGLFGYTFAESGEIQYQFKIIREISNDLHLCQLFSFWDGCPNKSIPIATEVLLSDCELYTSAELWKEGYEKNFEKFRRKRLAEKSLSGEFG